MSFQRSVVLDRCAHSVYVVPADWQSQARAKIPAPKRISWYCWLCRDYEAYKFSVEKLLELARANCDIRTVRKLESDALHADYDLPDDDEDDGLDVAA